MEDRVEIPVGVTVDDKGLKQLSEEINEIIKKAQKASEESVGNKELGTDKKRIAYQNNILDLTTKINSIRREMIITASALARQENDLGTLLGAELDARKRSQREIERSIELYDEYERAVAKSEANTAKADELTRGTEEQVKLEQTLVNLQEQLSSATTKQSTLEQQISEKQQEQRELLRQIAQFNKERANSADMSKTAEQKAAELKRQSISQTLTLLTHEHAETQKQINLVNDEVKQNQALLDYIEKANAKKASVYRESADSAAKEANELYKQVEEAGKLADQYAEVEAQYKKLRLVEQGSDEYAKERNAEMEQLKGSLSEQKRKLDEQVAGLAKLIGLDEKRGEAEDDISKKIDGQTKSQKANTAQIYYFTRSMKMLGETFDRINNNWNKMTKLLISGARGVLQTMIKLNPVVGAFANHIEKARKSNDSFSGSIGTAIKRLFQYTFGLRSLFAVFRLVRSGMVEGMNNLVRASTLVNGQMSVLATSFLYMKNSAAAAVQPLLRVVAPAVAKVAEFFNRACVAVGSFFAALTGQKFVYKAMKVYVDYAASLDKSSSNANKNTKKTVNNVKDLKRQLSGLDKLNVLTTPDDKQKDNNKIETPQVQMPNYREMFEEVPLDSKAVKAAEKLKEILSELFNPLKKAWEKEGQNVIASWKTALKEVSGLLHSVGKDFLEVWNQPETVKIFEHLLIIISNIGLVVANLASNFRKAWEVNNTGKHILESIRDIIGIIVTGIKNASEETVKWSKHLNFKPLLTSLLGLLKSMKKPIETLSNVFEYFWKNVVLKFTKYMIEEGLPNLNKKLSEVMNNAKWDKIEKNIKKVCDVATAFLKLSWDVFVEIIGDISEALLNFVGSDGFGNFLDKLKKWLEDADKNPEKVAKQIEKFALSLIGLKLAVTGLSTIAGVLGNIGTMATAFANLGKAGEAVAGSTMFAKIASGIKSIGTKCVTYAPVIGQSSAGGITFTGGLLSIAGACASAAVGLAGFVTAVTDGLTPIKAIAMLVGGALTTAFLGFTALPGLIVGALGVMFTAILTAPKKFGKFINKAADFILSLPSKLNGAASKAAETMGKKVGEYVAKFAEKIKTFPAQFKKFVDEVDWLKVGKAIITGILLIFSFPAVVLGLVVKAFLSFLKGVIEGFSKTFDSHSPAKKMYPLGENIITGILEGIKYAILGIGVWIKTNIFEPIMNGLKSAFGIAGDKANKLVSVGKTLISSLKSGIITAFGNAKPAISKIWTKIVSGAQSGLGVANGASTKFIKFGKNVVAGLKSGISEKYKGVKASIEKTWSGLVKKAKSVLKESTLKGAGKSVITGLKNGITGTYKSIKSSITGVWKNIKEKAKSALSSTALKGVGKHFINGLWSGMSSKFSELKRKLADILREVKEKVREIFEINSPSKFTIYIGEMLMEGLGKGVEENTKSVMNTLEDSMGSLLPDSKMVDEFTDSFVSNLSIMSDEAQSVATDMVDNLNNTFENLENINFSMNIDKQMAKFANMPMPKLVAGQTLPTNLVYPEANAGIDMNELSQIIKRSISEVINDNENLTSYNNQDIIIDIDGKNVFKAVRQQNDMYRRRTGGKSAFA